MFFYKCATIDRRDRESLEKNALRSFYDKFVLNLLARLYGKRYRVSAK